MTENFIPTYDLESLTESQRQDYIKAICDRLGVPDNLNLVALTSIDDGEGPSRLVPYAKRGATEAVRNNLEIDIVSVTNQMVGGSIVFTATAKYKKNGRQEISTGSKYIEGLKDKALDTAIMTAQTRALRRVTLQFIGAGVLDESEIDQRKVITTVSAPLVSAPAPVVAPSSEPGKDITMTPGEILRQDPNHDMQKCVETNVPCGNIFHDIGKFTVVDFNDNTRKTQEEFEANQAKLRADAIASLNKAAEPPVEAPLKKTRKPRGPNKAKVDLGPSVPLQVPDIKPDIPKTQIATTVFPTSVTEQPKPDIKPDIVSGKPRLTPDQVKPFRQRMFKLVNDELEPNGFAPKEGMGNADKMRSFAMLMFPDISNMNELSVEQWEKYLSTLEGKLKELGPVETVKYIEGSIGI